MAHSHTPVFLGFHAQGDKDAPEISASAFDSNGKRRLMSRAVAVNAPLREEGEVRNARFSRDVKFEEEEHAPGGGSRGARGPDGSELEVCCCQGIWHVVYAFDKSSYLPCASVSSSGLHFCTSLHQSARELKLLC